MLKQCPQCGFEDEGKFCSECGSQLKEKQTVPEYVVCPGCRAQVAGGSKFCNECGTPIQAGASPGKVQISRGNVGYDESVTNIDQSRHDSSARVGGNIVVSPNIILGNGYPGAARAVKFCQLCGLVIDGRYFKCLRCHKHDLCIRHFNEEFNCCEVCARTLIAEREEQRQLEEQRRCEEEARRKAEEERRQAEEKRRQEEHRQEEKRRRAEVKARGSKPGQVKTVDLGGGVSMALTWVAPGEFTMGSPKNELGRLYKEVQHKVRISKGYWMGLFPVTQAQWRVILSTNPS